MTDRFVAHCGGFDVDTARRDLYRGALATEGLAVARDARSHADIIGLWGSLKAFARDVDEERECVKGWRDRDSIPAHAFNAVVRAARRRGFGVTLQELADAAAKKKQSKSEGVEGFSRAA